LRILGEIAMFTQTGTDGKGCLKKQNQDLPSNIIGEFTIEDRHYLILLLSESPQISPVRDSEEDAIQEEVSRFEIQGQSCAIVEAEPAPVQPNLADLLSERELQIATLVSLGRVNKQIARQLHISEWTVATYIRRIFYKLGVDSRAAMVYRCATLIQQLEASLIQK
jgi:DNA-binding CsgD family transcriptional regulator